MLGLKLTEKNIIFVSDQRSRFKNCTCRRECTFRRTDYIEEFWSELTAYFPLHILPFLCIGTTTTTTAAFATAEVASFVLYLSPSIRVRVLKTVYARLPSCCFTYYEWPKHDFRALVSLLLQQHAYRCSCYWLRKWKVRSYDVTGWHVFLQSMLPLIVWFCFSLSPL